METGIPLTPSGGTEASLRALMERYGALLRAAVARHCPRDLVAETDDIHQEACIRVWRALSAGRKIDSPASYIYRIAATATIDAIRRVKARREEALDEPGAMASVMERPSPAGDPERAAGHAEVLARVRGLVATLSPDRRRAIGLHWQGLTTQEIADLTGWSEAKARNLVYRTLQQVRERLRAEGIEP